MSSASLWAYVSVGLAVVVVFVAVAEHAVYVRQLSEHDEEYAT